MEVLAGKTICLGLTDEYVDGDERGGLSMTGPLNPFFGDI